MENTQLSFLTALLGGKLSGDALTSANALLSQDPQTGEGEEFLAFLDGLLTGQEGKDIEGLPVAAGPQLAIRGQAGDEISDDLALNLSATADASETLPGLSSSQELTFARGRQFTEDPARALINTQYARTNILASSEQAGAAEAGVDADSETIPAEPSDAGAEFARDSRSKDANSRYDGLELRSTPVKPAGLAVSSPIATQAAVFEQAALETFTYANVAREVEAIDAERLSIVKAESAAGPADRSTLVNPVRDQIVAAVVARNGDNRLEIRLDPPELGRVTIGFEGDGADIVRAVVSTDTPETLDLMRRHADVFQRALEAQGFANLDLQFAEHSQRDEAEDQLVETSVQQLGDSTEETGPAQGEGPVQHVILGRLDRRL